MKTYAVVHFGSALLALVITPAVIWLACQLKVIVDFTNSKLSPKTNRQSLKTDEKTGVVRRFRCFHEVLPKSTSSSTMLAGMVDFLIFLYTERVCVECAQN